MYVDDNCYGPDGPMSQRAGWQQVADAASGCSYVTGRSLGPTDGISVLPVVPVPDMTTGLIGAIGTMIAICDRVKQVGSYHVFASLMAAAVMPLQPEVGLYSPSTVQKCDDKLQWDTTGAELFVLELLDIALKSWKAAYPERFGPESPWMTRLEVRRASSACSVRFCSWRKRRCRRDIPRRQSRIVYAAAVKSHGFKKML